MKKWIALILILSVMLVIFSGCTTEKEKASVVGKWNWQYQQLGDDLSFTFRADGTGEMKAVEKEASFTYTVEDGKINITVGDSTESCPFLLEEDTMTLTVNGEALKLTRTD